MVAPCMGHWYQKIASPSATHAKPRAALHATLEKTTAAPVDGCRTQLTRSMMPVSRRGSLWRLEALGDRPLLRKALNGGHDPKDVNCGRGEDQE